MKFVTYQSEICHRASLLVADTADIIAFSDKY